MKKLRRILFCISVAILYAIGKKIFEEQYLEFVVLSVLLVSINLFYLWFLACEWIKQN